jgi:hypothetical protein
MEFFKCFSFAMASRKVASSKRGGEDKEKLQMDLAAAKEAETKELRRQINALQKENAALKAAKVQYKILTGQNQTPFLPSKEVSTRLPRKEKS